MFAVWRIEVVTSFLWRNLTIAAVSACLAGTSFAQPAELPISPDLPTTTVNGQVVDANGVPISRAKLRFTLYEAGSVDGNSWESSEITDDNGQFSLLVSTASRFGHRPVFAGNVWVYKEDVGLIAIQCRKFCKIDKIVLANQPGTVFVVQDETGRPVEGAAVEPWMIDYDRVPAQVRDDLSIQSDKHGIARFPALTSLGLKRICVTAKGFGLQTFKIHDKSMAEARRLVLKRPGSVRIRLVGDLAKHVQIGRAGLSDVNYSDASQIHLSETETYLEVSGTAQLRNGEFHFPQMPPGVANLTIIGDPSNPHQFRINHSLVADPIAVRQIPFEVKIVSGQTSDIEILVEAGVRVHGIVRARLTGDPIPDACLTICDGQFHQSTTVYTDAQGVFECYVIPNAGEDRPYIQVSGLPRPFVKAGTLHIPFSVSVHDQECEIPPIEVDVGGEIAGTVVRPDGREISGLTVVCRSGNRNYGETTTDTDGRFRFDQLPADAEITFATTDGHFEQDSETPLILRFIPAGAR